jgi:hypothetical protein
MLLEILHGVTGSLESQMADTKPEVPMYRLVDEMAMKFQRLQYHHWSARARKHWRSHWNFIAVSSASRSTSSRNVSRSGFSPRTSLWTVWGHNSALRQKNCRRQGFGCFLAENIVVDIAANIYALTLSNNIANNVHDVEKPAIYCRLRYWARFPNGRLTIYGSVSNLSAAMSWRLNRFIIINAVILEDLVAMSATMYSRINVLTLENIVWNIVADIA